MPDYVAYHRSVVDEIYIVSNRVRNLVTHWPTDGEWKESALRTVLRRHLPESTAVGRGFIVSGAESSTQIDILVLREGAPTVFKDGDLRIVTPDAASAVVEVKTELVGEAKISEAVAKLARVGQLSRGAAAHDHAKPLPWLGLFAYEGRRESYQDVLAAVGRTYSETGVAVNCVTIGKELFVRRWNRGASEWGEEQEQFPSSRWRAYDLGGLSPSYFIGNLVDHVCQVDVAASSYAWFSIPDGKYKRMIGERVQGDRLLEMAGTRLLDRIQMKYRIREPFDVFARMMEPGKRYCREQLVERIACIVRIRLTDDVRQEILDLLNYASRRGVVVFVGDDVVYKG